MTVTLACMDGRARPCTRARACARAMPMPLSARPCPRPHPRVQVILSAPQPLEVIFNATALNVVLELDNIVAALLPRLQLRAKNVIATLGVEEATDNDLALYIIARREEWAPFGLQHMRSERRRKLLVTLITCLEWFMAVVHSSFYFRMMFVNELITTNSNITDVV